MGVKGLTSIAGTSIAGTCSAGTSSACTFRTGTYSTGAFRTGSSSTNTSRTSAEARQGVETEWSPRDRGDRRIYDGGSEVQLKGVCWFGFNNDYQMVSDLYAGDDSITKDFRTVRFPVLDPSSPLVTPLDTLIELISTPSLSLFTCSLLCFVFGTSTDLLLRLP